MSECCSMLNGSQKTIISARGTKESEKPAVQRQKESMKQHEFLSQADGCNFVRTARKSKCFFGLWWQREKR